MVIGETMAKMQKGTVDRISELPDFILHDILLILDTKEGARASVLSKRWYEAWSSIPVLDFRPEYFDIDYDVEDGKLQRYVEFIDNTMQRYLFHEYRIRKMRLKVYIDDEKVENLVDVWISIAVENQIQELEFEPLGDDIMYEPPEILFCARSLNVLTCRGIALPYYEMMELVSLKHLTLEYGALNEDMLQRIISLCPLVELKITYDDLEEPILLPWTTRVDGTVQSNPTSKHVRLKNDALYVLTRGLTALESLVLDSCVMLKCVKISSISLKELRIRDCLDDLKDDFIDLESLKLVKVTVDAPNLLKFSYNGKLETSLSLIRVADQCNVKFLPFMMSLTTDWFFELKEFLNETKLFNSLKLDLPNSDQIVIEQDELRNISTDLPCKIRVLKFRERITWAPTKSSLDAFLDSVFWCCHPDVLSITTYSKNLATKLILSILKEKTQCPKDPLKSVEVEFIEREHIRLLLYSYAFGNRTMTMTMLKTRFRLSW